MYREIKLEDDRAAGEFKDAVFLHSIASQIPGLYEELFGESHLSSEDEIELGFETFDTVESLREAVAAWEAEIREDGEVLP